MSNTDTSEIAFIKATNSKIKIVIDKKNWIELSRFKWFLNRDGYAITSVTEGTGFNANSNKKLFMHRLIMNPTDEYLVDHINRIPHDNREINLRICVPRENCMNKNSSRFKGVWFDEESGFWRATTRNNFLGNFNSEIEAAKVYNKVVLEFILTT